VSLHSIASTLSNSASATFFDPLDTSHAGANLVRRFRALGYDLQDPLPQDLDFQHSLSYFALGGIPPLDFIKI